MGEGFRFATGLAVLCAAAVLGACGGGERQDESEPQGRFPVEVDEARFPREQRLADTSDLILTVENAGDEQIPDVAVTIHTDEPPADGPFEIRSDQPGLANPNRPVWSLAEGYPKKLPPSVRISELDRRPPGGAEAAQTNTFSFGPLAPGDDMTMVWRVTALDTGTHTVHYEIAAGLQGQARAVTPEGDPVKGEFVATITDKPEQTRVNDSGDVVPADQGGVGGATGGNGNTGEE